MLGNNSQAALINDIASYTHDPLGFVYYAFPWGVEGGPLEHCAGPETWQRELLEYIGRELRAGRMAAQTAIQAAVASGHGIGKSALVSWLILWALATHEDTRGVVTANTETQLRTKTWPELAKWYRLSIIRDWFVYTATAIYSADKAHEKTWRVDAIPWSKSNTEAFAGLHNKGRRILLIFDEASAIEDQIWEVAEGALTDADTEIIWCAFGNPTRNTGRFFHCFHKFRGLWHTERVDSREVSISNKAQIQKWIDTYGIDSDFVKVRVRGEFPTASDRQFIGQDLVDAARGRHLREDQYNFAPVILTCDPAWYGDDELVIGLRQGLSFKILMTIAKNDNDAQVAGYIANYEDQHNADAVFIDQGYGTGIYSAGKQMGRSWMLVSFGSASGTLGYLNKRAEMWGLMRDWLREGGSIPDDPQLCEELTWPEYEVRTDGKIVLESKEDMKKRGLGSPGRADALALSFAFPVRRKPRNALEAMAAGRRQFVTHDFHPLA